MRNGSRPAAATAGRHTRRRKSVARTGTTITAKGVTWELDLGRNDDLRKKAEKLNGKLAIIRGELTRRGGVEIKERWIVKVSSLEAAPKVNVKKVNNVKGKTSKT